MVVNFTNSAATGVVGSITAAAAGIILSNTRVIEMRARQFSISALTLSLTQGSNTYSLPNKSGTIALTSDIQSSSGGVELWELDITMGLDQKQADDNNIPLSLSFKILTNKDVWTNATGSNDFQKLVNILYNCGYVGEDKILSATGACSYADLNWTIVGVSTTSAKDTITLVYYDGENMTLQKSAYGMSERTFNEYMTVYKVNRQILG